MITIFLHGPLKALYPEPFKIEANTPEAAIRGFCKITKALDPTPMMNGRHMIRVKGFEGQELFQPHEGELHLFPDFRGGGGFLKIIVGAVIIAVAAFTGQWWAIPIGLSLVLGGILELISPAPKSDQPLYQGYLGAVGNTTKIGTRIPLCYGRQRIYGQYLSYNIMARDVNPSDGTDLPNSPSDPYNGVTPVNNLSASTILAQYQGGAT